MVDVDWDERYQGDQEVRPWDTGIVEPELKRCITEDLRDVKLKRALEIGCGTGTNAIWLAEQGLDVVGTEISPTAIKVANEKLAGKIMSVRFVENDIVTNSPVPAATVDFVFDRGVFHVMSPDQKRAFVKHVAEALVPGGWWLCMAGSADETKPDDKGPPRLSATSFIASVEGAFEVYSIQRSHFELPDGSSYAAWRALFKRRE
jgi:SAM-dependent methyltransferase